MWADGVVDTLPSEELPVERSHLQGEIIDLVELLGVGAFGALDGAIELGRARGEHEEAKVSLLASLFKTCLELGASVYLYRSYWEGHPGLEGA